MNDICKSKVYCIQLTKIEKRNFSFYGNYCDYYLDVFNVKKQKIGRAIAPVVQPGVDYSSAYEYLYDYNANDDAERAELAEMLGVEKIDDEWLDEDGTIDPGKLPQEICEMIDAQEDEALIDYYYDEFSEVADENGFLSLADFAEQFSVSSGWNIVKLNINSPLTEMFTEHGIDGWYDAIEPDAEQLEAAVPDITGADKKLFVDMAALIADRLDDLDMCSEYINIRYDGDYDREIAAKKEMRYIYAEIAYVTIRSLVPRLDYYDEESWEELLMTTINSIGHNLGFTYRDDDGSDFEEVAQDVYTSLTDDEESVEVNKFYKAEFNTLIDELIQNGTYPMPQKEYDQLLEERGLKSFRIRKEK